MNRTGKYIVARKDILSMYLTADYPKKGCAPELILALQNSHVDLIEVGIPFSDPLADGPVIQESSAQALKNGFTLDQLFVDLEQIQPKLKIPLVPMGYFNTVLAFGVERFLSNCENLYIDTVILPDLSPEIFEKTYKELFERHGVSPVFLITPQTSPARIKYIDSLSNAFVYAVSNNKVTGGTDGFSKTQLDYFEKIKTAGLQVPTLIGFGISDHKSYRQACDFAHGAIIGSAFIKALGNTKNSQDGIPRFVQQIRNGRNLKKSSFNTEETKNHKQHRGNDKRRKPNLN